VGKSGGCPCGKKVENWEGTWELPPRGEKKKKFPGGGESTSIEMRSRTEGDKIVKKGRVH